MMVDGGVRKSGVAMPTSAPVRRDVVVAPGVRTWGFVTDTFTRGTGVSNSNMAPSVRTGRAESCRCTSPVIGARKYNSRPSRAQTRCNAAARDARRAADASVTAQRWYVDFV